MLRQSKNPYGYRNLLVYKKAAGLQTACSALTGQFPKIKTLIALADQMNRSARSTKQNISEGWKRNTTAEYYDFLGFAIASNAELEEDCGDIWRGVYRDLLGIKGIMGEKGERGENGEALVVAVSAKGVMGESGEKGENGETLVVAVSAKGVMGESGQRGEKGRVSNNTHNPISSSSNIPLNPISPFVDIESIPFYPLSPLLPPVVQLKLRAKELNMLLDKLQKSLEDKMSKENTLPARDKFVRRERQEKAEEDWYNKMLAEQGLVRLENGQVIEKTNKNQKSA